MPMNLPNILTLLRLIAAPMIGIVFILLGSPQADIAAFALFTLASATDWLDGKLARAWGQESRFGAMLDPIADKAMVVIALAILIGIWQGAWYITLPAVIILFREVSVSGLREFLGAGAAALKVTKLAKWKTTAQMVAVGLLLGAGIFQGQLQALYYSMTPEEYEAVLSGFAPDERGLITVNWLSSTVSSAGIVFLWIAALLTLITGIDYFAKAMPLLKEQEDAA